MSTFPHSPPHFSSLNCPLPVSVAHVATVTAGRPKVTARLPRTTSTTARSRRFRRWCPPSPVLFSLLRPSVQNPSLPSPFLLAPSLSANPTSNKNLPPPPMLVCTHLPDSLLCAPTPSISLSIPLFSPLLIHPVQNSSLSLPFLPVSSPSPTPNEHLSPLPWLVHPHLPDLLFYTPTPSISLSLPLLSPLPIHPVRTSSLSLLSLPVSRPDPTSNMDPAPPSLLAYPALLDMPVYIPTPSIFFSIASHKSTLVTPTSRPSAPYLNTPVSAISIPSVHTTPNARPVRTAQQQAGEYFPLTFSSNVFTRVLQRALMLRGLPEPLATSRRSSVSSWMSSSKPKIYHLSPTP